MLNVGRVCRVFPVYLPHELLGYDKNSLKGMLLTQKITNEVISEENESVSNTNIGKQKLRFNKFKSNK